jgi:hypothetical protein
MTGARVGIREWEFPEADRYQKGLLCEVAFESIDGLWIVCSFHDAKSFSCAIAPDDREESRFHDKGLIG